MGSIKLHAYAKVNLTLKVTGKLDNGYHALRSHMHAVALFDEVKVTVNHASGEPGVSLEIKQDAKEGDFDFVEVNEDNLAIKAAVELSAHPKFDTQSTIKIKLKKRIPVSAGLAGGSTDAAAVLLALNNLMKLDLNLAELIKIGTKIGADVPFCLVANAKANPQCGLSRDSLATVSALCEGIGDVIAPLDRVDGKMVLIKPEINVATAEIYQAFDDINQDEINLDKYVNVLQPVTAARYPEVANLLKGVAKFCTNIPEAKFFMSGSGPTVCIFIKSYKGMDQVYIDQIYIGSKTRFGDSNKIILAETI
jgi:4-diphosphocytidyl-2-C-methyl-D-erythritol kinase